MISMITLVISIGFSIDYSAHICHTFTHCLGRTRNLRAVECVVLMGTPVFHGAASTIAGILILGNSQSFIFRLFFKVTQSIEIQNPIFKHTNRQTEGQTTSYAMTYSM